ncbi:uncharacterized protein METZ01_LOCUS231258, partial [marine metagenome]
GDLRSLYRGPSYLRIRQSTIDISQGRLSRSHYIII